MEDKQPQANHSVAKEFKAAEHNAKDSTSTGGWDYVYLRGEDNTVKLIELHDSQERCSVVSTVLGHVGFSASVCLAVPTTLLPGHDAVPVISGNVLELGDWDVSCADMMLPAPEISTDGFAFFVATICSNYSEEDELIFRFALVSVPNSHEAAAYREVICWEGQFTRRMIDYKIGPPTSGLGCLIFGMQEAQLVKSVATTWQPSQSKLCPGWLSDRGLAAFVLRIKTPVFAESTDEVILQCPVNIRLVLNNRELILNHRGPLASSTGPVIFKEGDPSTVTFTAGCGSIRYVEFVQIAHLGVSVSLAIAMRFHINEGNIVEATVRLPKLSVVDSSSEVERLKCKLKLMPCGIQPSSVTAELPVTIRRIRYCSKCPESDVMRSLDRCGTFWSPPPGNQPIRIALLPTARGGRPHPPVAVAEEQMRFFELPLGLDEDGSLRCQLLSAPSTVPPEAGLIARLVHRISASSQSCDAAADAMLSALLSAEIAWTMVASSDMAICTALCLKQMRLPVAFVVASPAASTADNLEACRFYGLHAVVVRASEATPSLAAEVVSRGLALYTYGGAPQSGEVMALLEGIFEEGTFAELHN